MSAHMNCSMFEFAIVSLYVCVRARVCTCVWPPQPFINAELTWTCSEHPVPQPWGHCVCLNYLVQEKTQTDYCVLNASKIRATRNDTVPGASIVYCCVKEIQQGAQKSSFPNCGPGFVLLRIEIILHFVLFVCINSSMKTFNVHGTSITQKVV